MYTNTKLKNVLLIDDDEDIHEIVKFSLDNCDLPVKLKSFFEPYSAIEYTQTHNIDLILLDLCFSEPHEGSILLHELSTKSRNGVIVAPVLIISSEPNGTVVDYIHEIGAIDYLQKPFSPDSLNRTIAKYLSLPKASLTQTFSSACIHIS